MRKTVLVTGAAGAIGESLVEVLSGAGWSVVCSDHPRAAPKHAVRQCCQAWIPADLASLSREQEPLEAFRKAVISAAENNDFMAIVHNAAVQRLGAFEELTPTDWHETLSINLSAPWQLAELCYHAQTQCGSIVHIGSIHSQLTKPGFCLCHQQGGTGRVTRAMAVELGGSVRVNAIEPAAIATPMLEAGFADSPALKAQLEAFHPTGAIGSPADVARAVLFLLDPANSFLNGCVLPLGGGIHNRLHDPA